MPVQRSPRFRDGPREISGQRGRQQQPTAKERESRWTLLGRSINYRFGSRLSQHLNPGDRDELTFSAPAELKRGHLRRSGRLYDVFDDYGDEKFRVV